MPTIAIAVVRLSSLVRSATSARITEPTEQAEQPDGKDRGKRGGGAEFLSLHCQLFGRRQIRRCVTKGCYALLMPLPGVAGQLGNRVGLSGRERRVI
jgi:hypothetical protein